ncbi:MAG: C25 family cysteine peptidase, partial [Anaerolineales bacterium]
MELTVLVDESAPLEGTYTLLPGPRLLPLEEDLQLGRMVYEPDLQAYALDSAYPSVPVRISGDAWIRDQRVVRVAFFPFQYNPARKTLLHHTQLQIEVRFIGGENTGTPSESAFESVLENSLLNYEIARSWRQIPNFQITNYQSLGPRYEVAVDQDGLYRLTYAALQAAGMDVGNVDPSTFHLYNHGQSVAIYVFGEGDGSFDPGDYVVFYGEKFRGDILAARYADTITRDDGDPANNWFWRCINDGCDLDELFELYTDDNVYSLTEGGTPGPRMPALDGTPNDTAPIPDSHYTTVRTEQSNYWWSWEFEDEDIWFWDQIQQLTTILPFTATYTTTLTALAAGSYTATIHAEAASRNSTNGSPDHHTRFTLNSTVVDDAYWDGIARYSFQTQVQQSDLLEGENQFHLTMLPDVYTGTTRMYFDFFEITYARQFQAEGDQLLFSRNVSGTWQYEIGNFVTNTIEVYDVTEPFTPTRVLNPAVTGSGTYTVSFEVTGGTQASYAVVGANAIQSPKSILYYQPPDFANMPEADYIFVTHEDFIAALQPLVNHRTAQGLSVAVIDVDDLYREFNDGIYNPIAIRNFLAYAFASWQTPPTYVTLVGNGHWNFKGDGAASETYSNPPPIYMPPNLAYIDPWQGLVDSANLLATLVGDDTIPDLLIARIPVNDAAELGVVVDKTISYETSPVQDWQRNITFVTDNTPDDAGDFVALAEGIIDDYLDPNPYFQPIRIYQNDFGCTTSGSPECNAVTYAITDTINTTGTLLVNYIGHASLNRWSGEQIIVNADITQTLYNDGQFPIILSMTCLDGYWTYPNIPSLVEDFLRWDGRGAVATFSATGLGVATGHDDLQRGFFDSLFNNGEWQMGTAALQAKIRLESTSSNLDLVHTFTTFGDPALRINSPAGVDLTPESTAQSANAGTTVTYSLQLANAGALTDTYAISITGNAWSTVVTPTMLGPLIPGQSAGITITVDIPSNALGNEMDVVAIQAASRTTTYVTDSSTLTTTALTAGLILLSNQTDSGLPGATLTYTLQLTNTSNVADTFTITLTSNNWVTTVPSEIGPLNPGESQSFTAVVRIPASALGNDTDLANLAARSQNDPGNAATASLTSMAVTSGLALTPQSLAQSGPVNTTVTYTLQVTNLLNTSEYFSVTIASANWTTTAPATIGPIVPGGTATLNVGVAIPDNALGQDTDSAAITVAMLSNPIIQATSTLTTTALTGGLILSSNQTDSGPPGATLTYTLQLTNTSNVADTFTITLTGNNWATTVPSEIGPINPGESQSFTAVVRISTGALGNDTDLTNLTAQSQNDPGNAATVNLTSTAVTSGLALTPQSLAQSGPVDTSITYTLQVTNLFNTSESFSVTIAGANWTTTASVVIGPSAPGGTATLNIGVAIPASAADQDTDSAAIT